MAIVGYPPYNNSITNPYDYTGTPLAAPYYGRSYTQLQSTINVVWITGEEEALRYPIGPNSAVVLWDAKANKIYLKKADATGNPIMKTYSLIEEVKEETSQVNDSLNEVRELIDNLAAEVKSMKKDIYGLAGKKDAK